MYQSDYDEFTELMKDLCAANDRPVSDERVRAFWDALKPFPFAQIKARIKAHIAKGKKWPLPSELRPPENEQQKPPPPSVAEVTAQLTDFVLHNRELTPRQQTGLGWTFLHRRGDPCTCVGLVIPADGEWPGHRVMVEDMQGGRV